MAVYVFDKSKGCLVPAEKMPPKRKNCATWPVHSEAMGCSDAQQVKDEQEFLRTRGVSVEYDSDFRPIWTSRRHKKAYLRALGHADPDASYSDAEPLNFSADIHKNSLRNPENRKKKIAQMREELIAKEYRLFGQRVSDI